MWVRGRRTSASRAEASKLLDQRLGRWARIRVGDRVVRVDEEGGWLTLPERLIRCSIEHWMRTSSFYIKVAIARHLSATFPDWAMDRL